MGIPVRKVQASAVADAEKVSKASTSHWPLIKALGATDAERREFDATIAKSAGVAQALPDASGPSLEDTRLVLKDSLGEYRASADLVADGFAGADAKLRKVLRADGTFPTTDAKLAAYVDGLPAIVKRYGARLAARGFKKEAQDALAEQIALFRKLLASRGADRGERRARRLEIEALFDRLRRQTSYFRRLGRRALRNDDRRAEFDRVQLPSSSTREAAPKQAAGATGG